MGLGSGQEARRPGGQDAEAWSNVRVPSRVRLPYVVAYDVQTFLSWLAAASILLESGFVSPFRMALL